MAVSLFQSPLGFFESRWWWICLRNGKSFNPHWGSSNKDRELDKGKFLSVSIPIGVLRIFKDFIGSRYEVGFNPHWGSSNLFLSVQCFNNLAFQSPLGFFESHRIISFGIWSIVSIPIGVLRIYGEINPDTVFVCFNPHWGSSNDMRLICIVSRIIVSIPIGVLRIQRKYPKNA